MQQVTVFIEQEFKGNFASGVGEFSIVLELKTEKGTFTREHYRRYKGTTKHRMAIWSLINALQYMKKQCEITVKIDSPYVVGSVKSLEAWQKAEPGKKANWDLWEKYLALAAGHKITVEQCKENEYAKAMKIQRKMQEIITLEDYRPENEY